MPVSTSICASGAAQPIPGSGTVVVVSAAAIESALVLLGLEGAAAAIGPLLAGTTYNLTQLCGTDPPADPMLSASDVADALDFTNPLTQRTALDKVVQWFLSWYWYYACECTTGTTPAVPAPSNPGTPVSTDTGLPYSITPSNCWDQKLVVPIGAGNGTTGPSLEFTSGLLPATQAFTTAEANAGVTIVAQVIPPGVKSVTATVTCTEALTNGGLTFGVDYYKADGTFTSGISSAHFAHGSGVTVATYTQTPPTGAVAWSVNLKNNDGAAHNPTLEIAYTCTGGTTQFQQPCCPPDPAIMTELNAIEQLLGAIYSSLPAALSSYAEATVHSGLTGNGSITLADAAVAVKVDITSDSSHLGVAAGDPTFLFDRGFIVPFNSEGPIFRRGRLVFNPQVFPLPELTDSIGYSLNPLVTVSITELVRGP